MTVTWIYIKKKKKTLNVSFAEVFDFAMAGYCCETSLLTNADGIELHEFVRFIPQFFKHQNNEIVQQKVISLSVMIY